jgi:hypothetical protein
MVLEMLVLGVFLRRGPVVFMKVVMWGHGTFDSLVFRCGKIYYYNSISIANFVWLLVSSW